MSLNNNQEQKCQPEVSSRSNSLHENCLSRKVLELEYEIRNTQKYYTALKKPMKCFAKFKKSLKQQKDGQRSSESGILSQKIISPNIGDDLICKQKSSIVYPPKTKNIFQAYKQTLEFKYRKRMRQIENSTLKIESNRKHNESLSPLIIIQQKQDDKQKNASHKNIEANFIKTNISSISDSKKNSRLKNHSRICNNYYALDTIDNDSHNFIRSINRKQKNNVEQNTKKKFEMYQIKRKCHTENASNGDQIDFNKTRNVSFRLPSTKRCQSKVTIENLAGPIYTLPSISQKIVTPKENHKQTISYRVKSLKNNSYLLSDMSSIKNKQNTSIQKISLDHNFSVKIKQKRHYTLPVEEHNHSMFNEGQIDHTTLRQEIDNSTNFNFIKSTKFRHRRSKLKKQKSKQFRQNGNGQIQGWIIENEQFSLQNTVYPFNNENSRR